MSKTTKLITTTATVAISSQFSINWSGDKRWKAGNQQSKY